MGNYCLMDREFLFDGEWVLEIAVIYNIANVLSATELYILK